MLLVVSLWLGYMNVTITKIPGPSGLTTNEADVRSRLSDRSVGANEVKKPGFFAVFTAGVKIIFDELKERTLAKKDIVITNEGQQKINFISEAVEPIRGTRLPD